MKKLMITAAALMVAVAAYGQGQFAVNFKGAGNDIKFVDAGGALVLGTEGWNVEILAGPDVNSMTGLGSVALNRTAAAALGYPNPTVLSLSTTASSGTWNVGYQAFKGADWASATDKGPLISGLNGGAGAAMTVVLNAPPNLPNTVNFGTGTAPVSAVPEPATLALGLLGLGTLLAFRRRQ